MTDAYCTSGNSPTGVEPDFLLHADSFPATVFLLIPLTSRAHEWAAEHISGDVLRFGCAIPVEHRFLSEILAGIQGDGLKVSR